MLGNFFEKFDKKTSMEIPDESAGIEQTKDYNERSSRLAEALSTSHNIRGLISKEDIQRIDAQIELEARNGKNNEYIEMISNSDLILLPVADSFSEARIPENIDLSSLSFMNKNHYLLLEGKIKGKDLRLLFRVNKKDKTKIDRENLFRDSFSFLLNGNKLSLDEAQKIYEKYGPIAETRTSKILELVIQAKKEKEKEDEEDRKNKVSKDLVDLL